MTVAGDAVLIGDASAAGGPALAELEQAVWQDIPVAPATAQGAKATLIHLAVDQRWTPGRIVAMGTATGGASEPVVDDLDRDDRRHHRGTPDDGDIRWPGGRWDHRRHQR